MRKIHADQGPRLTMQVSERERSLAKAAKEEFKGILKDLDSALKIIYDLRDAIVQQRPSKEDLQNVYRGRLLRYRKKITEVFNKLLIRFKNAIQSLGDITDPDMANLKKIMVSEFDELSDGIEGVLTLLDDAGKEGFTKELERLCTQMQRRSTSISEIIDNRLFSHIDSDILGKLKVSELKTRIIKRTRIIQKIAAESNLWDL
jgi:mevalonate kinase